MLLPEGVGEPDVDEAGAGDIDLDDVGVGAKRFGDGLGERARVLAGGFGQHHGGVGGEVAVAGVARRLDGYARQVERAPVPVLQVQRLNGGDDPLVEIGEDVHVGLWKP